MSDLGARIRQLRKSRGWTTIELAEKAGLSQGMISHIETGRREGSRDVIQQIAEAFNVSSGLLQDPLIPLDKLEHISYILHEVQDLNEEQTSLIRQMISTLKSSR